MPSHNDISPEALSDPAKAFSLHPYSDLVTTDSQETDHLVRELETLRQQIDATSGTIRVITEWNKRGYGLSLRQLELALLEFEHTLRRRLEFETFLFDLSRTFIGLPEQEVDVNMERGLAHVGEFLQMDRVTLLELSPPRTELSLAYSWSGPGVMSTSGVMASRDYPWWVGQVLRGEVSLASHVDDLPEEA